MPRHNVVDAYAEVGKEPEDDDWRKKVAKLARPKPLEEEEQEQNCTGDSNDASCNRQRSFITQIVLMKHFMLSSVPGC